MLPLEKVGACAAVCPEQAGWRKEEILFMVKILTDSSCDLSVERCAELDVEMLPITVHFGEESYRANLDITNGEFYEKLAEAKELPKTAQIPPAFFEQKFREYQEHGDEVVCLSLPR